MESLFTTLFAVLGDPKKGSEGTPNRGSISNDKNQGNENGRNKVEENSKCTLVIRISGERVAHSIRNHEKMNSK